VKAVENFCSSSKFGELEVQSRVDGYGGEGRLVGDIKLLFSSAFQQVPTILKMTSGAAGSPQVVLQLHMMDDCMGGGGRVRV
jgi:hypothetical protein